MITAEATNWVDDVIYLLEEHAVHQLVQCLGVQLHLFNVSFYGFYTVFMTLPSFGDLGDVNSEPESSQPKFIFSFAPLL